MWAHGVSGRTGKKEKLRELSEDELLDMRVDLMRMPGYGLAWQIFGLPALADVDDVLDEKDED